MSKIKLSIFFIFLVLISLSVFVYANFKNFVYPPLHRNQFSPTKLLPEAASISLQVMEYGDRKAPKIALTFDADMTPEMLVLLKSGLVKSWYNAPIKETLDKNNDKNLP